MRNMVDYIAKIKPINADKIETQAHGIATFSENGNSLHIHVEMFDTPANIEHWEHFHGFPDGKQAYVPMLMQDVVQYPLGLTLEIIKVSVLGGYFVL